MPAPQGTFKYLLLAPLRECAANYKKFLLLFSIALVCGGLVSALNGFDTLPRKDYLQLFTLTLFFAIWLQWSLFGFTNKFDASVQRRIVRGFLHYLVFFALYFGLNALIAFIALATFSRNTALYLSRVGQPDSNVLFSLTPSEYLVPLMVFLVLFAAGYCISSRVSFWLPAAAVAGDRVSPDHIWNITKGWWQPYCLASLPYFVLYCLAGYGLTALKIYSVGWEEYWRAAKSVTPLQLDSAPAIIIGEWAVAFLLTIASASISAHAYRMIRAHVMQQPLPPLEKE